MLTPEQAAALDDIGSALVDLGEGVRRFAGAQMVGDGAEVGSTDARSLDALDVEALWKRLGAGNRNLLVACARSFEPGEKFTLEEMAKAVDAATGSVKARLMNIGRSLKSMGNDFTVLWDSEWGLINMTYAWRPVAHGIIFGKAAE